MTKWWAKPMRVVTLEFPASDVATIDVQAIVNELHEGAVNTLCVFCTGYYPGGTAFYQSKIAPLYPGLGERDLLAETIQTARANGQKVIAYIATIWGGRELFQQHPDWAQRQKDGSVTSWDDAYSSVAMCPNSPYRQYLNSIVCELIENYDLDGFYFDEPSYQSWCSCSYCQEKFYAEYHQPLPIEENWGDPVFQKFIHWRYEQISAWRKELYDLASSEKRCVFFQGAFPLSSFPPSKRQIYNLEFKHPYVARFSGVDWFVPMGHASDMAYAAELGDLLHFELYRRSVREPLWWYGVSLRYGQAIAKGKPILTLGMMAQSPFELYGLPEAEIRLSVAELLANESAPLFARYYPDRVDQDAWGLVYDCLREAREIEAYLVDRQSVKFAALLFSESTLHRFDYDTGHPPHLTEMKGFARAMLQSQVLFDVITEADLTRERLAEYKVLILPNASCLRTSAKDAIRQFVNNGGGLVASYESGMYDEQGNRTPSNDLADLFGVTYDGSTPGFAGFDVYMKTKGAALGVKSGKQIPTGGLYVGAYTAGAKSVATILGGSGVAMYGRLGDESRQVGVVTHQVRGKTAYFASPIGHVYYTFGVVDLRQMMIAALQYSASAPAGIRVENAPHTMALTAFDQPREKRTIIHLVNSVQDEIQLAIEDVQKGRNVRLRVNLPQAPREVTSVAGIQKLTWRYNQEVLTITIPLINYYAVVAIEH